MDIRSTIEAALAFAEQGIPVLPIVPGEKRPTTGHGYKNASTDPAQIERWWSERPDAGLGIATGSVSGLVVVDIDVKAGDGFAELAKWEAEHGKLPNTTSVRTPSGGEHRYFSVRRGSDDDGATSVSLADVNLWPSVGNAKLLPNVDIRGDGGLVVAPPTERANGSYRWLQRLPAEPMPDHLHKALLDRSSGGSGSGKEPLPPMIELLNGVPEGKRNDTIFHKACSLRRFLQKEPDEGRSIIEPALLTVAANSTPPYPVAEALKAIDSAFKQDHSDPPGFGPTGPVGPDGLRLTDEGNASRFARDYADRVRYVPPWKQWLLWDDSKWNREAETGPLWHARETARSLYGMAAKASGDDQRKATAKHALASESASRVEAMLRLAKADPLLVVAPEDLDTHNDLLNTPSGVVDLRTGELREPDRSLLMTQSTSVPYDPTAASPQFERLVAWAMGGDPELIEHLQRSIGVGITGQSPRAFFLWIGRGANGKSTLLSIAESILGDYSWHAEPDLLVPKREGAATNGQADLFRRRFVITTETREGRKLDEKTLKALTGNDTITARRLYSNDFTFRPTHTIFLAANHRPVISDDSTGMWDRIRVVPFTATVDPSAQEPDLAERLVREEGPGILAWAVRGAVDYYRHGLPMPDAVRVSTEKYQSDEDVLGSFVEEVCALGPGERASREQLFDAYSWWCMTHHIPPRDQKKKREFMTSLEERFGLRDDREFVNGSKRRFLYGISVVSSGEGSGS